MLAGSQHPQVEIEGAGKIEGPRDGSVVGKLYAGIALTVIGEALDADSG